MAQHACPTPRVLSIAGTDPTGGAGVQADLKSIAAHRGYGMAAVSALVAQNTCGVRSIHLPPASFLREQLDAVSDDVTIDSVKIGMLANTEIVNTVIEWVERVRPPIIVLDPVIVSTSGDRLLSSDAENALRTLIPLVDLLTPNVPELAVLAEATIAKEWGELLAQGRTVAERYQVAVSVKGGHLAGDTVSDAVVEPGRDTEPTVFISPRVNTSNTHGTGCSLSAAMATLRPQRSGWEQSLLEAKDWLVASIRAGEDLRVGHGHGPVNHFAQLWNPHMHSLQQDRIFHAPSGGQG